MLFDEQAVYERDHKDNANSYLSSLIDKAMGLYVSTQGRNKVESLETMSIFCSLNSDKKNCNTHLVGRTGTQREAVFTAWRTEMKKKNKRESVLVFSRHQVFWNSRVQKTLPPKSTGEQLFIVSLWYYCLIRNTNLNQKNIKSINLLSFT